MFAGCPDVWYMEVMWIITNIARPPSPAFIEIDVCLCEDTTMEKGRWVKSQKDG